MSSDDDPATIGLTTYAQLRRGTRFSLATGGGLVDLDSKPAEPPPGGPIELDAFEIVERLGEGGMGVVYLAEQHEPVRRHVALKVLKSALADPQAKYRFAAERQAMARLAHPFIAQIFAAGTSDDGHPYFVMEHVDGVPITEYCDRNRLTVDQRLALARDVCRGVQHAHQKGILHRDLKPSNVLVAEIDGEPVPKIIDFGIAKGLDEPLLHAGQATEAGLVGTPGYFSPEMVRGEVDIDTRSDVYALGVLLYELLVGARPLDDGDTGVFEVLRRIVRDDPPPPSVRWGRLEASRRSIIASSRRAHARSLGRRLRGDLDAIVVKAIARERPGRYDTAAALADDLTRTLRHEPVVAGPAGSWYRLRKLARRHRGAALAAVLLVAALAAGLVLRTVEARRANREAEAARQVTRFLVDMFEASDPRGRAEADLTARELLDQGAERLRDALLDQPLIRAELLDTIGTVYRHLGVYDESAALTQEALALRRSLLGENHLDVAESLDHLGMSQLHAGHLEEAEAVLRQALAIKTRGGGREELRVADTLVELATVVSRQDENQESLALLDRAVGIRESRLGPDHDDVAEALTRLAEVQTQVANYEAAETAILRALTIREKALGPDHLLVAASLDRLARLYLKLGRTDEAIEIAERNLATAVRIHGDDSPELLAPSARLSGIYFNVGRYDEATRLSERAIEIADAHPDVNPLHLAEIYSIVASIAHTNEDYAASLALFQQTRVLFESVAGEESVYVAQSLNNIASSQMGLNQLEEAESAYRRSLEIQMVLGGADHPETAFPRTNLGEVYRLLGQLDRAEAEFLEALRVWQQAYGPDHTVVAFPNHGLGSLYLDRGQLDQAEAHFRRALAIRERTLEPGAYDLRETRQRLAEVLRAAGRAAEASTLEALDPADSEVADAKAAGG